MKTDDPVFVSKVRLKALMGFSFPRLSAHLENPLCKVVLADVGDMQTIAGSLFPDPPLF